LGCAEFLCGCDAGFRARLIFQPGEEGFFGAVGMIEAGCLEGVQAIVGGHVGNVSEELKPGQCGFKSGSMMANADRFEGSFKGSGGHGSAPHQTRDPITALSSFVMACNASKARDFDQTEPVVLSICAIESGTTHNVIPSSASFKGTVRTFSAFNRELAERRLREIGEGIAKTFANEFAFTWLPGYPVLVNDERSTDIARKSAERCLGTERIVGLVKPCMGGEDFAYFLQQVPGCFWFMSTNDPGRGISMPNHNPRFDIDERYLWEFAYINLDIAFAMAQEARRP
jgi:amidohydrolase